MKRYIMIAVMCVGMVLIIWAAPSFSQVKKILGLSVDCEDKCVSFPTQGAVLCSGAGSNCPEYIDYDPTQSNVLYGANTTFASNTFCRKSVDRGLTWTTCPGAVGDNIEEHIGVAVASDGSVLISKCDVVGGIRKFRIYRSTDGGNSFSMVYDGNGVDDCTAPSSGVGNTIACAKDNSTCIAVQGSTTIVDGFNSIRRFVSFNNGITWDNSSVVKHCGGGFSNVILSKDGTRGFYGPSQGFSSTSCSFAGIFDGANWGISLAWPTLTVAGAHTVPCSMSVTFKGSGAMFVCDGSAVPGCGAFCYTNRLVDINGVYGSIISVDKLDPIGFPVVVHVGGNVYVKTQRRVGGSGGYIMTSIDGGVSYVTIFEQTTGSSFGAHPGNGFVHPADGCVYMTSEKVVLRAC